MCIACWFSPCRCKTKATEMEITYDESRMDSMDYFDSLPGGNRMASDLGRMAVCETSQDSG
jgi:hypothetical protein